MTKLAVVVAVTVAMIWVAGAFMKDATKTVQNHKTKVERSLNY